LIKYKHLIKKNFQIYHGQNLENERKIGDYNIREKSIIDLVYRMSGC